MFHDVTVNIGIQLTLMLLINSREAAMGTEYDMIDEMGVTHNDAKIVIIERIGKFLGGRLQRLFFVCRYPW